MKKLFSFYRIFTLIFIVLAVFYGGCGDYKSATIMLLMLFINWVCNRMEQLQTEKFHLQQRLFQYELLQQLTAKTDKSTGVGDNSPAGDKHVE